MSWFILNIDPPTMVHLVRSNEYILDSCTSFWVEFLVRQVTSATVGLYTKILKLS